MAGGNDAPGKAGQHTGRESLENDQDFAPVRPAVTVLQDEKQGKNPLSKLIQKEKTQKSPAEPNQTAAQSALPAEFLERRRRQKRKKLVKMGVAGAVVAVALVGGVGWYLSSNASDPADLVSVGTYTEEVTKGDLELTVEGSGTLAASATVNVSPEYAGTVSKVSAKVTSVARTASSSTAYYDVGLTISKPTFQMRQGMNATAVITSTSFTDVLLVPVGAVTTDDNKTSTVTVLDEEAAGQAESATPSEEEGTARRTWG